MDALLIDELILPSVDYISSALERSNWNADFSQLDRGRQGSRVKFVGSSHTSLLRLELGNRARQLAEPESGRLNFGIPTRAQASGRSHPRPVLSVEELCRASACSVSTLERAFRDHFGIPPKQYLLALRLSGARRGLLASESQRMIGDIASEWGFWHMSKFSADYQRMFGELPSATRLAAAA